MPIKGLTDEVRPALPQLGKLRKGGERVEKVGKDGKTHLVYGVDLQHFRFTSLRPEVVQAFTEAYGAAPALINVFLPYTGLDANFATWREEWRGNALQHRCDGETMTIWIGADGKYHRCEKACPNVTADEEKRACKPVGRLNVIIPELVQRGYAGYVTMETHSVNDIMAITATLLDVLDQRQGNAGGLRGIPFVLRRAPYKINAPISGKRAQITKWLVTLEPAATWLGLRLSGQAAEGEETQEMAADKPDLEQREYDVDEETGEVREKGEGGDEFDTEAGDFPPEPDDDEPEPPRWQDDPEQQSKFRIEVKRLGLKIGETLEALGGVQSAGAYSGTYDKAMEALAIYAEAHPRQEKGRAD